MTALDEFKAKKRALKKSEEWAEMIGKTYYGGGGGVGELRAIQVSVATLYFQLHDGDTNYHSAPKELLEKISDVVMVEFTRILELAISSMQIDTGQAAEKAAHEYRALMEEAGLATE